MGGRSVELNSSKQITQENGITEAAAAATFVLVSISIFNLFSVPCKGLLDPIAYTSRCCEGCLLLCCFAQRIDEIVV